MQVGLGPAAVGDRLPSSHVFAFLKDVSVSRLENARGSSLCVCFGPG